MMKTMFRQAVALLSGALLLPLAGCSEKTGNDVPQQELTQYVRPLVGTAGFGNTYPGAQIPFGGIQMSPDTDFDDYDVAAGYKYDHPTLLGFSLTHLSGTGCGDYGDILLHCGEREKAIEMWRKAQELGLDTSAKIQEASPSPTASPSPSKGGDVPNPQ